MQSSCDYCVAAFFLACRFDSKAEAAAPQGEFEEFKDAVSAWLVKLAKPVAWSLLVQQAKRNRRTRHRQQQQPWSLLFEQHAVELLGTSNRRGQPATPAGRQNPLLGTQLVDG